MRLEEARKEILKRINLESGFEVPEYRLLPQTRQSITVMASIFRQLVTIREVVTIDKKRDSRLVSKAGKILTGKEDSDLQKNLAMIEELQETLKKRMSDFAKEVVIELQGKSTDPEDARNREDQGRVIIEPLRCPKCGADLGLPTSRFIKCAYCESTYTLDEYLDRLDATIHG